MNRREVEREKDRENPKQDLHCQHIARCRARTHETVRSWSEPKSRARCLSDWATQAPQVCVCVCVCFNLSNLFTLHGAWIHNSKVKSHMLFQLSQPGTPRVIFKNKLEWTQTYPHKNVTYSVAIWCAFLSERDGAGVTATPLFTPTAYLFLFQPEIWMCPYKCVRPGNFIQGVKRWGAKDQKPGGVLFHHPTPLHSGHLEFYLKVEGDTKLSLSLRFIPNPPKLGWKSPCLRVRK